jgi:hypothetical protein
MELSQGAHGGSITTGQGYQIQSDAGSKVYISAMIRPIPKSKKDQKSISRQVNLTISSPPATTEYLRWSDQMIRFSRADHPRKVPRPGHAPMVLKAQIGGYDVGRVFMDAGSGTNRRIRCQTGIYGRVFMKARTRTNGVEGNEYLAGMVEANGFLLPRDSARK